MPETILVNVSPLETRVALLESGLVQEVYFEHEGGHGIVGNIYLGKITRILPGIQAAFVDIGLDRNGILALPPATVPDADGSNTPSTKPALFQGQKILVQVTHEPREDKGPRLGRQLTLSSRYLVLTPGADYVGVSQQIRSRAERERLQQLLAQADKPGCGVIVRTAAEGVDEQAIAADLQYLQSQWQNLQVRAKGQQKPVLLYTEPPLFYRLLRDRASSALERVVIDDADGFNAAQAFCQRFLPAVCSQLELHKETTPLFEAHGVDAAIEQALGPRVELGSGAYLVIEQTEAMTTIDINSGSFVGGKSQEDTALQTNLEAVPVLARQLRLRNLGGIIVVDFIDLQQLEHRRQLELALAQALHADPAVRKIASLSALGLVEIGRKRIGQNLQQALCEKCPSCDGRGVLKSAQTVCYEILRALSGRALSGRALSGRALSGRASGGDARDLLVLAAPAVVDRLRDDAAVHIAQLQSRLGGSITVQVDGSRSPEDFDIIRVQAS